MIDKYIIGTIELLLSIIIVLLLVSICKNAFAEPFSSALSRCEKHRETVEQILRNEAVSTDYYYLMVAESRCTERAESSKGAQGFWQLMPTTARHYGCNNPHDLKCSTVAAARYIRHLSASFKTFEDVIRAYNMGGHNYRMHGATAQANGLVHFVLGLKKHDAR